MSENEVPKFEDTTPVWEETVPVDKETSPKISKSESALTGAQQGLTLGFSDELAGLLGGSLDVGQSVLSKLGIASPSPSQVSEQLISQGFKGDIGPQSTVELYQQMRDAERAKIAAAKEASPVSFGLGEFGGGMLTTPFIPGGAIAKNATLRQKVVAGAKVGAGLGAVTGTGTSEADLSQGNITGLGEDILSGIETGAIVGGGIPVAGAALKGGAKLAGKLVPESAKQAFAKGMQGIDVASKEFYEKTGKKLEDIVSKVSRPILAKSEAQQAANAATIESLDNQISGIQKKTQDALELGKMRQVAQNAEDIKAIDRSTVDTAKDLQKSLFNTKKSLSDEYNKIDKAAEATGIVPENRDIIGNFIEEIETKAGLDPAKIKSIQKLLVPNFGQKDMQSFRNLKATLNSLSEYDNPVVKKAARQAYGELKGNFANELSQGGYGDLANRLSETNKRWSAISSLEEDYLSNLRPHRVTGEFEASPDTTKAIQSFLEKSPEQIAKSETMSKLLNIASPETAPQTIQKLGQLAEQSASAKAFKPEVPELPNPELTRLQNLLQQTKAQTPKEIPSLNLPVSDKVGLEKELTSILPKYEMRTADQNIEKKLGQTFDFLKNEIGESAAGEIKKELAPLAKDLELRKMLSTGSKEARPLSVSGAVEAATGGLTKAAGKAGLAVKGVQDVMSLGIKKLAGSTPEQIKAFGQKMFQTDPASEAYVKVLNQAAGRNEISKNAIIFGLMQQPEFRKLYKKTEGIQDEQSGE